MRFRDHLAGTTALKRAFVLAFLAAFLAALGCSGIAEFTVEAEGDFVRGASGVYLTLMWWALGGIAVVWVAFAVALLRWRGRPSSGAGPVACRRITVLDLAWAVAPAIVVVLVAVPTVRHALTERAQASETVLGAECEVREAYDRGRPDTTAERPEPRTERSAALHGPTPVWESDARERLAEHPCSTLDPTVGAGAPIGAP